MYQSWVSYGYLFGNYQAGSYNCTRFILGQTDNSSGIGDVNQIGNSNHIVITSGLNTKNTVHTLKLSRGSATFDGTNLTSTPVAGTANSYKIVLFGNNSKGTVTATKINPRIYYFKIYDNGILVRDFVPAIRKSDSKPGLYDLVSEEFFINSGTGEFLYGSPGIYGINYLSQNTLENCEGLYITGCPGIDNNIIVKSILKAQSENPKLERIRVDGINTTNGTYNEIFKLSQLQGYYDNGSEYSKPVLNGTYTIDEWITNEMLSQVNNKIEGLTINTPKIIDWNELAVQTLDPEKPNYNPAVAIILNNNSKGTVLNDPIIEGGGRYFLTKTQAAAITSISTWFQSKTSVADSKGLVSSDKLTYNFNSFDEFKYFTGVTSTAWDCFSNCKILRNIILPISLTSIGNRTFDLNNNTYTIDTLIIPERVTSIGAAAIRNTKLHNYILLPDVPPTCTDVEYYAVIDNIWVKYSENHSIINSYKNTSNWSSYSSIIKELNPDGTIPNDNE